MSWTTADFITSVQTRAAIPTNQGTFTDTVLLALADEETMSKMVPLILKQLSEYYVRIDSQALTANQASYLIPTRAIAGGLRDVQVVDATNTQNRIGLPRLSPEELYGSGDAYVRIQKTGFYLQGNAVIVYPTPASTLNYLWQSYYCRPNKLVEVTDCALIQSIDTSAKTITVVSLPAAFTVNTPLDFVKANPHFECSAIDQTPSNIASTTLTFTTALPSDLAVGDYLCLAGQSCVVQVPAELQPLLMQYVVVRVLASQADAQALASAEKELDMLEKNVSLLLAPRVTGKTQRAVGSRPLSRWV